MNYRAVALWMVIGGILCSNAAIVAADGYFEIQVVDEQTGKGVPLVELKTVNHLRYVTDNAGRVAFYEPGLMNETVFFSVSSHGYEMKKDGFGIAGIRLEVKEGGRAEIKVKRLNIAERLYRSTGQGLYRDSVMLKKEVPLKEPLGMGGVVGQDSVSGVPYRGKIYWFWGDTSRISYPLGLFRMAGATSELPGGAGLPFSEGIDYQYFTGKDGFCRAMVEVANPEGVVWAFGFATVPDKAGNERLVCHYSRRKGLTGEMEHGMMVYNDEREIFEVATVLDLVEKWRFLDGQPVKVSVDGVDYLYSGVPFPTVRVPATLEAVLDSTKYEAFRAEVKGGETRWQWTKDAGPSSVNEVWDWWKAGLMKGEQARFLPLDGGDPESKRRVRPHTGSVRWNPFRKKWVMIAVEHAYHEGKEYASPLGEVWYSEADAPEGPFEKAVKILTHQRMTFYNPVHHDFFDEEGGRVIYFEGTYTNQFVESEPTPGYDYNQIMYRLDLNDPRLVKVFQQ
ncbi:hypothetical protein FEM03_20900 [Phragmitibacter flavus]|uniref:Carboxypeptidase regulatory-like domain-containing protein n=1 Tax=Phragmitibacter flavus TaxID=2576071 RepID=A0A5R8K8Y6_9BACT|nr:hypothetical protein [Phragmitibacter flavus]TLD68794.1 hypothetical protein FEM03_20900 [Phragmitibacter flavus]